MSHELSTCQKRTNDIQNFALFPIYKCTAKLWAITRKSGEVILILNLVIADIYIDVYCGVRVVADTR